MPKRRKPGYLYFDEMTSGPFEFLWRVPTHGFIWRDQGVRPVYRSESERLLNGPPFLVLRKQFDEARNYPAFEQTDLHRRFAKLWNHSSGKEIDPEDVRRFANEWGWLGHGIGLNGIRSSTVRAESRRQWFDEIVGLTIFLDLWDVIKYEQADLLRPYIRWSQPDEIRGFELDYKPYTIEGRAMGFWAGNADEEARFEYGSVIAPFRDYLFRGVNDKLRGHVSPVIHPFEDGNCIYMSPDCLLSAMYVLFILEIAGFIRDKRPAKVCQGCGAYFSPEHARQLYCNEACRWRTNKRRRRTQGGVSS
jgi:hypothetical protein